MGMNNNENIIMGIDQSYNFCAWVILRDGCMIDFGIVKSDTDDTMYERALNVAIDLYNVYEKYVPNRIQIEGLAFGTSGNVTRDLAGLLFTIINVMKIKIPGVDIVVVPPTAVKKFATGSGKSKKPEIIAALPKEIIESFQQKGFKKTTGLADLADAFWIGRYSGTVAEHRQIVEYITNHFEEGNRAIK